MAAMLPRDAFLACETPSPASVTFLAQMDFFSLWAIILLVIGYSIAAKVSKWRAAVCVVGLWVLLVAATTGLGAPVSTGQVTIPAKPGSRDGLSPLASILLLYSNRASTAPKRSTQKMPAPSTEDTGS